MAREPAIRQGTGRGGATRFKKGKSGNPSGRPAMFPEFREECRKNSPKAMAKLLEALDEYVIDKEGERVPVLTAQGVKAAELILAYAWGKPTQLVNVTGDINVSVTALLDEARARVRQVSHANE